MSYFISLAWENISINTGLNGKQTLTGKKR